MDTFFHFIDKGIPIYQNIKCPQCLQTRIVIYPYANKTKNKNRKCRSCATGGNGTIINQREPITINCIKCGKQRIVTRSHARDKRSKYCMSCGKQDNNNE